MKRARCEALTRGKKRCRNYALGGTTVCQNHANWDLTPAQQAASRTAAETHGATSEGGDGFTQEEIEATQSALDADPGPATKQTAAIVVLRAKKAALWEARQTGPPHRAVGEALAHAHRVLASLPRPEESPEQGLSEEEVLWRVEERAKDHELWLKRFDAPVQEKLRAVLREAGLLG